MQPNCLFGTVVHVHVVDLGAMDFTGFLFEHIADTCTRFGPWTCAPRRKYNKMRHFKLSGNLVGQMTVRARIALLKLYLYWKQLTL